MADSAQRLSPLTVNLLPGQDVLTVSTMADKIEALVRCMGCGFVPEAHARCHIDAGRLVVKPVQRAQPVIQPGVRLAHRRRQQGAARHARAGTAMVARPA